MLRICYNIQKNILKKLSRHHTNIRKGEFRSKSFIWSGELTILEKNITTCFKEDCKK